MYTIIATHPEYPHDFRADLLDMDAVDKYLVLLAEYLENLNKNSNKIMWRLELH